MWDFVIKRPASRMNSACMQNRPNDETADMSIAIGIWMNTEKINQVRASNPHRCNQLLCCIAMRQDLRNGNTEGFINFGAESLHLGVHLMACGANTPILRNTYLISLKIRERFTTIMAGEVSLIWLMHANKHTIMDRPRVVAACMRRNIAL